MATTLTPILSAQWDAPRSWSLDTYESGGGYGALRTALAMAPADVVTHYRTQGFTPVSLSAAA